METKNWIHIACDKNLFNRLFNIKITEHIEICQHIDFDQNENINEKNIFTLQPLYITMWVGQGNIDNDTQKCDNVVLYVNEAHGR